MIPKMNALSHCVSVSGCETKLMEHIKTYLEERQISVFKENDCLIVKKEGKRKEKHLIFLSVAADLPGFICLSTDQKKSYLAKTGSFDLAGEDLPKLLDESGHRHILKTECKDSQDYYVSKGNLKLGDVLSFSTAFSEKNERMTGRLAGRYALLALIMTLAGEEFSNDVLISFTASSLTSACRENGLIRRFRPDQVILLGQTESVSDAPILLKKDGKAFGPRLFSNEMKTDFEKSGLRFDVKLRAKSVTKAESIYSVFDLPVLPILLPVEQMNQKDESVLTKSVDHTLSLLRHLLNQ